MARKPATHAATTEAREAPGAALTPLLRFSEFRGDAGWVETPIGTFLTESRIPGSGGDVAKKLTVKLWGKGVVAKTEALRGSENTQYYRRSAGQFIYSKLDFLNQAFGIIPQELDGFESTVDLPCFDVSDSLNPKFLLEYVQRESFYARNGELADGNRKAKRIQTEDFLAFSIAVPERFAEQQKIADCLTSLDECVAAQARKVEVLKAHKKGLMQALFPQNGERVPRLRFPEFRDGPSWNEDSLADLCSASISYGIVQAGPHVADGMPYIKSSDLSSPLRLESLTRTSAAIAQKYRRSEVLPGDIVFSLRGNIGVAQIVPEEISVANLTQGTARLRPSGCVKFLLHALQSPRVQGQIEAASKGSTFHEISLAHLRNVQLCFPGGAEQQRIADCLASLDAAIDAASAALTALKALKKGLIQSLFPAAHTATPHPEAN